MGEATEKAERVRALLNGHQEKPKAFLDAIEFLAEPDPDRRWLIEGFIEPQSRILMVGDEGAGKSLLALTAAVQAAAGIQVLERFEVNFPIRTVYMDLEMPRNMTRRRLRALSHTAELEKGALSVLLQPDGIDLFDPTIQQQVWDWLGESEPELVVIDPFYKLSTRSTSAEEDVAPVLQYIDRIRDQFNSSIILVHHLRKRAQGEGQRGKDKSDVYGSALFLRWPETIMILGDDRLGVAKDRDGTFEWQAAFPIKRGGHWPIQIAERPRATTQTDILKYIEEHGPCMANDVVRHVPMRREEVLKAIRLMEGARLIVRRGSYLEVRDPDKNPEFPV